MGKQSRARGWVCMALLIASAGCADKLRYESSFTLPEGDGIAKTVNLPAQPTAQTINIEVRADHPVEVYIMPAKDTPNDSLAPRKEWETKSLAFKRGITSETLVVKVPAHQETNVVVALGKTAKAQITVKMSN